MKTFSQGIAILLLGAAVMVQAEEPVAGDASGLNAIKQSYSAGGCFYIHSVDSYRVIDPRHIVLYAPSRHKPWLIEFSHACPLLRNGDAIMLEGNNGQVCGNAGDALKTRNQNCGINKTYSISKEDADAIKALSK